MAEGEKKSGETVPPEAAGAVGDSEHQNQPLKPLKPADENVAKESGDGPTTVAPVKPVRPSAADKAVRPSSGLGTLDKSETPPPSADPRRTSVRKTQSQLGKEKRPSISSANRQNRLSSGSTAKLPEGSLISFKRKQLLSVPEGRQFSTTVPDLSGPERADRSKLQIIKYMNSYRLESKHPFRREPVYNIIRDVFNAEFANMPYEPIVFAKACTTIACEIRTRVKALGFERYKLVCVVQICEKNRQSVNSIAKFLWDPERDNCTSYSYDSTNFLASGAVFGLYYE